ncbi:N-6 DNA methylase [Gammaproteobacteria bacterium]|nr:N-6 DNA methylase [Gammaproteobacteria bacterium]
MDLTGIENEAEFFPAGTLSDVLEVELQDITGRWSRELEGANPVTRLSGSADAYLRLYRQLLNTTDKNLRNELYSQSVALVSTSLGYDVKRSSETLALDAGSLARVMNKTFDADGKQALWIIETPAPAAGEEQADPLGQAFDREQYDSDEQEHAELEKTIEELLADGIFGLPDAPRYILVAGASQWVLVDQRKWPARSVLRFDLQEIFSRQDRDTFRIMACLVAREARVPATGIPIADRLEEEAQRNANAVTTSLKRTVRDAIEILGQEVLDVTGGKFPTGPKRGIWIDGPTLSLECLRYMYRLLFLLYAESNPRLRILDLKDPLYASGYSMEALRDLESVRLRTPQEKNGSYLWDSLQQVLTLLYSGENHVLKLPAVKVSLLDPESTPLLNSVSLRNEAVQKIIRQLSLRSSKKNTGRISYSKLGIGQLGAVYETLISFTGTVAKEDMIELKGDSKDRAAVETDDADNTDYKANDAEVGEEDEEVESRVDKVDLLAPTYLVPRRRITEFNPEAVVFEGTQAKIYQKGSFTYRLAGRDREKTAAYYTPEPLARLLVKHLLMERCKDLAADEILELKILEPAMGSAAFLVETTNQLADLYLERKQIEVGQVIPQEEILLEKQKVRSYIADRNCFGVDLNPTAVELGAISLWLNGLHKGEFSPWFGDQLHAGNSLIGARRAVYPATQLKGTTADLWFKNPPKEIGWKEERPENTVYQWLLPAGDMAAFEKDKTIKEFAGEHQARIKAWRAGGFFKPLESHEINLVKRLTNVADELFDIVASETARTRDAANDEITIWPDRKMSGAKGVDYQKKEILKQRLLGEDHAQNTLPFKRLKTAMDAWCALWLWPIEKADKLPSRQEFLEGMRILLEGGFSVDGSLSAGSEDDFAVVMGDLFDQQVAEPATKYNVGLFQETNVEAFIEEYDWLQVATEVANEARFVHYDLIFADILKSRAGFDLIVGNPPWAKPNWNEGQVLADLDPLYAGMSASEAKDAIADALEKSGVVSNFLHEYSLTRGGMKVTSSPVMNPFIGGGSNNLYRCFMDLSFRLTAPQGYTALIHQDGHFSDPKAGTLRSHWYKRIVKHFEFSNRISSKLFSEVNAERWFSLNIYRGIASEVDFYQFTAALLPAQIVDSYADADGSDELPGKKNKDGEWDTRGHKDRIIHIDRVALETIHSLSEEENVPLEETRFVQPFSNLILEIFKQLASFPKVGSTLVDENNEPVWQMAPHWHESGEQKKGTIKEATAFRPLDEMIIQGPQLQVGNPINKTPRRGCKNFQDYETTDLASLPEDYLPRTNFGPRVPMNEYRRRITKCRWDPSKSHGDFYRIALRNMIALNGERSLVSAVIPPKMLHVDLVESIALRDNFTLLNFSGLFFSLVYDFLVKASGISNLRTSFARRLPYFDVGHLVRSRVLALSSLTVHYIDLWSTCIEGDGNLSWSEISPLVAPLKLSPQWSRHTTLRSDYVRRLALLEIDVLVAKVAGLDLDQLIEIFRIYYPVLKDNEDGTWYDQNGRIVWTSSKGLLGVGYLNEKGKSPGRKEWESILESNPAELVCTAIDDTLPDGPHTVERRFVGPFFKCDRVEDYKRAWAHFEKLEQEGAT